MSTDKSTTPEIENMYLKALEITDKYKLGRDKQTIDALTEMYRLGVVYAVKTQSEMMEKMS